MENEETTLDGEPLCEELKGLLSRALPKWPGLLVVGKSVSLEQAEEILIRTASFHFSSNDRAFQRDLYKALGVPLTEDISYPYPEWEILQEVEKKYGNLPLEYLHNSQIVSSYVGGPHGWCDWEGNIGCNSYNIGKWPSVEEVYREWKLIAAAFPFLILKSQLFNGETCESDERELRPIVQFNIADGVVWLREPEAEPIGNPTSTLPSLRNDLSRLFTPGRERGCTINKFKHALETTLKFSRWMNILKGEPK